MGVDTKIVRVGATVGPDEHGHGYATMWARMRSMPPIPDRQDFVLERWHRVTFVSAARHPARLFFDFRGTLDCEETDGGTILTHAYELSLKGPGRWLERFFEPWLQRQIEDEVQAIAERDWLT